MKIRRIAQSLLYTALLAFGLHAQSNPIPLVNNPLMPAGIAPGSGGFTFTVNGTGFVQGSVVNWNQSPRATTFVSASRLTAVIPPADVASAGTASVTVVNPAPGGGRSNVVFFAVAAARPSVALATKASYHVGYPSNYLLTGDFNGDGRLDLAASVWNHTAHVAQILLGNGDGTFQPPSGPFDDYCCGGPMALGDFNGDGKLDVVTIDSILLGNGDGTLQSPASYVNDGGVQWIAAADFNGDGKLDLAVACSGANDVVDILLGNGDGTFQAPLRNSIDQFPGALAVGDFNSDGRLDLALANDGGIALLLGNGDGTFQAPTFTFGKFFRGMIAADLNGDGILDLVATAKKNFHVLLGHGDGTFAPMVTYKAAHPIGQPAIGDFNGDGRLDLAFTKFVRHATQSQVFPGNGDGTFGPSIHTSAPLSGYTVVGDFNGDGQLDLASAAGNVSSVLQTTVAPSPAALLFPAIPVGKTTAPKTLTVTNIGPSPLNITQAALTGADAADYSLTANGCQGATVAPSATCTISVTFTPTAGQSRTATISLTDNAVASPQAILLEGQGTGIHFDPASLDFGSVKVGTPSPQMVATLINTTSGAMILHYFINGPARQDYKQHNSCGKSIQAHERCSVIVTFRPDATGQRSAELQITTHGYPPALLQLVGAGTQ